MTRRFCHLCGAAPENDDFGQHIDGHHDDELHYWPGGVRALIAELEQSMAESRFGPVRSS